MTPSAPHVAKVPKEKEMSEQNSRRKCRVPMNQRHHSDGTTKGFISGKTLTVDVVEADGIDGVHVGLLAVALERKRVLARDLL